MAASGVNPKASPSPEDENIFCRDRYGEPMRREEVTLAGSFKKKKGMYEAFMTIGISTIKRKTKGSSASYLERTLNTHLKNLTDTQKEEILIVIFLADWEKEKRDSIQERLMKTFDMHIKNNTIKLIYAPKRFYSSLSGLPQNFNDTKKRVRWRSKQALDYAFLAYYCSGLGKYYFHLEDDLESLSGFYKLIKDDLLSQAVMNYQWSIRRYGHMGFIGMLIKDEFLHGLADFWRLNYFEMPLDWSYMHFLGLLTRSGQEKDSTIMRFRHIGRQSSSLNDDVP
eukprot:gene10995-19834_t